MRGIDFTSENTEKTESGQKCQTRRLKPTYKVGQTLYVRQSYYLAKEYDKMTAGQLIKAGKEVVVYFEANEITGRKRNKRFMPYKFAKQFICITDMKEQLLQDISLEDCIKEGVQSKDEYANLFDSIHGTGAWQKNPKIYIYDYEKVTIT